jgi:ATP-dependent DNA helicase PIF1
MLALANILQKRKDIEPATPLRGHPSVRTLAAAPSASSPLSSESSGPHPPSSSLRRMSSRHFAAPTASSLRRTESVRGLHGGTSSGALRRSGSVRGRPSRPSIFNTFPSANPLSSPTPETGLPSSSPFLSTQAGPSSSLPVVPTQTTGVEMQTGGFRRRGQDSQDTESQAITRRIVTAIEREHRTERRGGVEPPLTPGYDVVLEAVRAGISEEAIREAARHTPRLGSALTPILSLSHPVFRRPSLPGMLSHSQDPNPPDSGDDEQPMYFHCEECGHLRGKLRRIRHTTPLEDLCYYDPEDTPWEQQMKFCPSCSTEKWRTDFCDTSTGAEDSICNACRPNDDAGDLGPVSSQYSLSSTSVSYGRRLTGAPYAGARQRALHRLQDNDPSLDKNSPDWRTNQALTDADKKLLETFHQAIERETMEICDRCNERWFNMSLDDNNVCIKCRLADSSTKRDEDEPFLYSSLNNADPGGINPALPKLTMIEELLIARVHTFVEVYLKRGAQYRYKGHVINFMRNVGKVYNKLPLLVGQLDVILLRPANATTSPRVERQFRKSLRVRRSAVKQWLEYLIQHHPGYRGIVTIDNAALDRLPDGPNGVSVEHEILSQEVDDVDINPGLDNEPDEEDFDDAEWGAVPDIVAEADEVELLRRDILGERGEDATIGQQPEQVNILTEPTMYSTPLNDFNNSHALLSLAFPTLFPRGLAEFTDARPRAIPYAAFVKHLFLYKDLRFQQHPRFRYVVFNTLQRKQVNTRSMFFVKKIRPQDNHISLADLRRAFEDDSPESNAILNSITRFSASMRGTRPYWNGKRHGLESMLRQIGCSHLFITTSAADLHWHSLLKHMGEEKWNEYSEGDRDRRVRLSREFLRDNPAIGAYHFHRRFELFRRKVLDVKFCIEDYWNRYEWQSRGSPHNHGLYWVKDAPSADQLPALSEELRRAFVDFWGIHVSALNPFEGEDLGPADYEERTVMSYSPTDITPNFEFLGRLLKGTQRHVCTQTYCQRKNKNTQEIECRFGFPHTPSATPFLAVPEGRTFEKFFPARNDEMLNQYNRLLLTSWLANIDIAPCTSLRGVVDYVVKYASKAEKESESYRQIATRLLSNLNPERPFQSLVAKLMNQLVGERDWSSQEVCHYVLELPLINSSRTVISVDMRPQDQQSDLFFAEGDEPRKGKSVLQKYLERSEVEYGVTYLQFLLHHNHSPPYSRRPQAAARILNFFPRYRSDNVEDFARCKLMLHQVYTSLDSLKQVEDEVYDTYFAAWEAFRGIYPELPLDGLDEEEIEADDSIHEDTPNEAPDEDVEPSWDELGRRLPDRTGRNQEPNMLGQRLIDLAADWTPRIGTHVFDEKYWDITKTEHPANLAMTTTATREELVGKQRTFHDHVVSHYQRTLDDESPDQLFLSIDGSAGTGKTFATEVICKKLHDMAIDMGKPDPVLRGAPTGMAANNVSGRTLHSLFRLPIATAYQTLGPGNLRAMQALLKDIYYILVDEKSMVGLRQLSYIDLRCREARPHDRHLDFGGLSVILMGDFCQLPPVAERPLYSTEKVNSIETTNGQRLYKNFRPTIVLDQVMRQQGQEQAAFRLALSHIRIGECTMADWLLLSTRTKAQLNRAEIQSFDNSVRLYAKKDSVFDYNHTHLRQLEQPVIAIMAKHQGKDAEKADTQTAGNLQIVFFTSINARVMLTTNVWSEAGLCNGSFGYIRDICWSSDCLDPRQEMPHAILVAFDDYTGPAYLEKDGEKLVPILPVRREWARGGITCTRMQFPLVLGYAITIHKSQGLSLEKAVLDISNKADFAPGLTYVAISRIRTLSGVLFETNFDVKRLRGKRTKTTVMRAEDAARRLPFEVQGEDGGNDELPQLGPSFAIPIRSSSPVASSNYGTSVPSGAYEDFGMSELGRHSDPQPDEETLGQYEIPTQEQSNFQCETCNTDRGVVRRVSRSPDVCIYCRDGVVDINERKQWCFAHNGEAWESTCFDRNGIAEPICGRCQGRTGRGDRRPLD